MTTPAAARASAPVSQFWGTRRELPLVYAILAIALIEAATTHLVVVRFAPRIAWALTVFSLGFLAMIVWIGTTLRTRPVTLDRELMHVRIGLARGISVPLPRVRLALSFDEKGSPDTTVGTPTLLGSNCCVTVEPPLETRFGRRPRAINRILMSLDDVAAFAAELDRRKASLPAV